MDKLLIIDGSNLLFQMFFGMPARIFNKSGKGIWGTLGFVGATLKLIKKFNPTYTVILFDGETTNERKSLDENYKANRPNFNEAEVNENPFSQLDDIYLCLDYLKIKHTESFECEVDDLIASYVKEYKNNCEIIISSYDSDFFQLVDNSVSLVRYKGDGSTLITPSHIQQKLGVTPSEYADFKALTGDNADNIKGIRGVGPKTAAALIKEFKTTENLINNAQSIKKATIKQAVLEGAERLKLNYKLIKLCGETCLPFNLEELRLPPVNATTTQVLKDLKIMD